MYQNATYTAPLREASAMADAGFPTDAPFTAALLQALIDMAARSTRSQADLTAALRGAGLAEDAPRVRAALRLFQAEGLVETLVPLSDGGLLLTVTRRAADRLVPGTDWLKLNEPEDSGG